MNRARKYYQQGIATKTVIIIGIVVLVAALLIIEGVSHTNRTESNSTEEQAPPPQWYAPTLVLSAWDVEVPLLSNSLMYNVVETELSPEGTVEQYGLTFVGHQEIKGCAPDGPAFDSPAIVGHIERNPEGSSAGKTEVAVDGAVYVYTPLGPLDDSSWMCATTQEGQDEIRRAAEHFPTLFKDLRTRQGV